MAKRLDVEDAFKEYVEELSTALAIAAKGRIIDSWCAASSRLPAK